jgi:hypothetical protein
MATPTTLWTPMSDTQFVAGLPLREGAVRAYLLQNLQWLGSTHDHSGDAGDGGTLTTADPKSIWFYGVEEGMGIP